nr:flavodoxin [uncultured Clostridium sp.]
MKKLLTMSLAILLLLFLGACSTNDQSSTSKPPLEDNPGSSPEKISDKESPPPSGRTVEPETQEGTPKKVLIAYFSQARIVSEGMDAVTHATPYIGNTESVALEIQKQIGGDSFQIITEKSYPVDHKEASAIAEEEMRSDVRPALTTHVENMDDYDVVFLGYPIWWYIEPMAIRTFLEDYDFSGKTIIPFCTSLGVDVNESVENIKKLCPDATVLDGLRLSTGQEDVSEDISEWLSKLDLPQ